MSHTSDVPAPTRRLSGVTSLWTTPRSCMDSRISPARPPIRSPPPTRTAPRREERSERPPSGVAHEQRGAALGVLEPPWADHTLQRIELSQDRVLVLELRDLPRARGLAGERSDEDGGAIRPVGASKERG